LFQFAAIALGAGDHAALPDTSGHGGVARALTAALRRFGPDAKRQQLFLPRDVFERHGVSPDDVFAGQATAGLAAALAEMRGITRDHLTRAKAAAAQLPKSALPAFLPLALVEGDLGRLEKGADSPFDPPRELPGWRRQLSIWRAARRGLG